jgi:hypothetical protein
MPVVYMEETIYNNILLGISLQLCLQQHSLDFENIRGGSIGK